MNLYEFGNSIAIIFTIKSGWKLQENSGASTRVRPPHAGGTSLARLEAAMRLFKYSNDVPRHPILWRPRSPLSKLQRVYNQCCHTHWCSSGKIYGRSLLNAY